MKESIQRVGGAMSGMVIPNIGAFIAWGLITALYIPTGWLPNEDLVQMVGPMISDSSSASVRLHRWKNGTWS
jgi:PTS system mannitol-specific IIC component